MSRFEKPKFYIIEGVDGSGKTTFAKWIEETHGFFYHHYGPPTEPTWVDEYLIPDLLRSRAWGDQIIDRGWVAEPMWAGMLGRRPLFPLDEYATCAQLYSAAFDFRILILDDDTGAITKRILDRGEGPEAVEQAVKAKLFYKMMPGVHVDSNSVHEDPQRAFEFLCSDEYFEALDREMEL